MNIVINVLIIHSKYSFVIINEKKIQIHRITLIVYTLLLISNYQTDLLHFNFDIQMVFYAEELYGYDMHDN